MGRLNDATFAERNCNNGGVVAEESAEDAKPVTVRLFHDMNHPSALHIPLVVPNRQVNRRHPFRRSHQ